MKNFTFLGLIISLLSFFCSPAQAGDVFAPNTKLSNANKALAANFSPIEPITQKPIEPSNSAQKGGFWKKFKPNKLHKKGHSNSTPISKFWYRSMAQQSNIFGNLFLLSAVASIILIFTSGTGILLYVGLAAFGIMAAIPLFKYSGALWDTLKGNGDGRRFFWGYSAGILSLIYWIGLVIGFIFFLSPSGSFLSVIVISIFAVIFGPLFLIFNIIDHTKSKEAQPEESNPAPTK